MGADAELKSPALGSRGSDTVIVHATWDVREGFEDRVHAALERLAAASRQEEGNELYLVAQDPQDRTRFQLFEVYRDRVSLERHQRSDHYVHWAANYAIPLLEKREVTVHRGLDL